MSAPARDPRLLVVALGGHALHDRRALGKPDEWLRTLETRLPPLVELAALGFRLVLTHGNGAQLGHALQRLELARKTAVPRSLDLCAAETQGGLGYAIQQAFGNLARARKLDVPTATLVTRVAVDPADPAFQHPTTPLGPPYTAAKARQLARECGWTFAPQAGQVWRRVVPSPRPLAVLETDLVGRLLLAGAVVIACGGGGIPVVDTGTGHRGVEAVVEPDFSTELLATRLGATGLVFATGVERAAVRFGTPQEIAIERLTIAEARALLAVGEFPAASMGPKVEAGVRFVEAGGHVALISSLERLRAGLEGEAGTRVVAR